MQAREGVARRMPVIATIVQRISHGGDVRFQTTEKKESGRKGIDTGFGLDDEGRWQIEKTSSGKEGETERKNPTSGSPNHR